MSSLVEKYYLDSKIADEIENWVLRDDNSIKWQFTSNVAYEYKTRQKQIEEYGHEFSFLLVSLIKENCTVHFGIKIACKI